MARLDLSSLAEDVSPAAAKPAARAAGRLALVPLSRVAPNHVNPRTNFGSPEELADLGRSLGRKQLQAIRCVSKSAYERLFPEHAEELGAVDVVVVNGERRYRAALAVELPSIEAVIDDDLAESRQVFLDAVITENVDRQNFDPIEEAHGIDMLVGEFGSADAVAAHYGRHKSWVSQRRSLLKLSPEVQDLVRIGTIPIRRARELASVPATQQMRAWEESLSTSTSADSDTHAPGQPGRESTSKRADKDGESPRMKRAEVLPWDSPSDVAGVLITKMAKPDLVVLTQFLQAEISKK